MDHDSHENTFFTGSNTTAIAALVLRSYYSPTNVASVSLAYTEIQYSGAAMTVVKGVNDRGELSVNTETVRHSTMQKDSIRTENTR